MSSPSVKPQSNYMDVPTPTARAVAAPATTPAPPLAYTCHTTNSAATLNLELHRTSQLPPTPTRTLTPERPCTPGPGSPQRTHTAAPYAPASLPLSSLVALPDELLLKIAEGLPLSTLFHLHLCCHRLHNLFVPRLNAAFKQHAHVILPWATERGSLTLFTRALAAGAHFTAAHMSRIIVLNHAALLPVLFTARPAFRSTITPPSPPPPNRPSNPPLHHAACLGSYECVVALLREGAYPDLLDAAGNTALLYAMHGGFENVARALVGAGAGRALGDTGADAVRYALKERQGMLPMMVEAGWVQAGVTGAGMRGGRRRDEKLVGGEREVQLGGGVGRDGTPVEVEVQVGRAEETPVQMEGGVGRDEMPVEVEVKVGRVGDTALQTAARDGKLSVVRQLLAAGADMDEVGSGRGKVGWSPLHECVCRKGRGQILDLLLENGAKVDTLGGVCTDGNQRAFPGGGRGLTPLQLARKTSNWAAVAKLVAYGARR
ncbi:ankyrin repeat-containing domain protein [Morchella snyderi]|nr:ankyrin repeat-containing domain protein [Morchella snyderi]